MLLFLTYFTIYQPFISSAKHQSFIFNKLNIYKELTFIFGFSVAEIYLPNPYLFYYKVEIIPEFTSRK